MTYIIILGLGLVLLYTLRDYMLDRQNRRDELDARRQATYSSNIIHSNEKYCKENISQRKISA